MEVVSINAFNLGVRPLAVDLPTSKCVAPIGLPNRNVLTEPCHHVVREPFG